MAQAEEQRDRQGQHENHVYSTPNSESLLSICKNLSRALSHLGKGTSPIPAPFSIMSHLRDNFFATKALFSLNPTPWGGNNVFKKLSSAWRQRLRPGSQGKELERICSKAENKHKEIFVGHRNVLYSYFGGEYIRAYMFATAQKKTNN